MAKNKSTVFHPRFGKVVVPHESVFSALLNAAEYWRVDWTELRDAEVRVWEPGDGKMVRPKDLCRGPK